MTKRTFGRLDGLVSSFAMGYKVRASTTGGVAPNSRFGAVEIVAK